MKSIPITLMVRDDLHLYRKDRGGAMFDLLETGECDVIIAPVGQRPSIASTELYSWNLVAVAPAGLWEDSQVAIGDVLDQPLLLSPPNHVSRELVDTLISSDNHQQTVVHESASTESLLALVDAGLGVALLPDDSVWSGSSRTIHKLHPTTGDKHALHWREGEEESDPRLADVLRIVEKLDHRGSTRT